MKLKLREEWYDMNYKFKRCVKLMSIMVSIKYVRRNWTFGWLVYHTNKNSHNISKQIF